MKLVTTESKAHWCKVVRMEIHTSVGAFVEPVLENGRIKGHGSYAMMTLPCGCKGLYHREELKRMDQT